MRVTNRESCAIALWPGLIAEHRCLHLTAARIVSNVFSSSNIQDCSLAVIHTVRFLDFTLFDPHFFGQIKCNTGLQLCMGFKLVLSHYGKNMCNGRSQTGAEEDISVCGGGSSRYLGEGRAVKES